MIMDSYHLEYSEFVSEVERFILLSNSLHDGWVLHKHGNDKYNTYIKKEVYSEVFNGKTKEMLKAEYLVSYNISYGVPIFSFNYWKSTGVLLSLEEIRNLSNYKINREDFYSVITQQEHPLLFRPFFVIHPCHTGDLLKNVKKTSKNIIVSFLSVISPLLQLNMPLEYALL